VGDFEHGLGSQAVDEAYSSRAYPETADAMRKDRFMANAPNAPAGAPSTADPAATAGGLLGTAGAVSDAMTDEVLNEAGVMSQMANFATAAPRQAMEHLSDLGGKLKGLFTGNEEAAEALKTGELSPGMEQKGQQELANAGFSMDRIGEVWGSMDPAMRLLLGMGVTLGGIGLISAMSGGGIGSWLMAALGLGGAGAAAAGGGMFGEGAQNALSGIFGGQGGEAPQPATSDAGGGPGFMQQVYGGLPDWMIPDSAVESGVGSMSPEQQSQLRYLRDLSPEKRQRIFDAIPAQT